MGSRRLSRTLFERPGLRLSFRCVADISGRPSAVNFSQLGSWKRELLTDDQRKFTSSAIGDLRGGVH